MSVAGFFWCLGERGEGGVVWVVVLVVPSYLFYVGGDDCVVMWMEFFFFCV